MILCLSGGGVKGAFQIGFLQGLFENKQFDIDEYYGISAGALNSAFLSQYTNLELGVYYATLFWKDYTPSISDKIKMYLGRYSPPINWYIQSKKPCYIGVVSMETAEYKMWDISKLNVELAKKIILGSTKVIPFMKPEKIIWNNSQTSYQHIIDGGYASVLPIIDAIKNNSNNNKRILAINVSKSNTSWNYSSSKLKQLFRTFDILMYQTQADEKLYLEKYADRIYYFDFNLSYIDFLDFSKIKELLNYGYNEGLKYIIE